MEWSGGLELKPRGDFGERVPLSDERARAIHNFRGIERLLTDIERAHIHLNAVISPEQAAWPEQYGNQKGVQSQISRGKRSQSLERPRPWIGTQVPTVSYLDGSTIGADGQRFFRTKDMKHGHCAQLLNSRET